MRAAALCPLPLLLLEATATAWLTAVALWLPADCFLIETVLPYVVDTLGASQADVDKIVYDNPRRFFENKP